MPKSKRSKACDISSQVKQRVWERDGGRCVVCGGRGMPNAHYIGRAQGGLGIEENIVTLCIHCHTDYDNGKHRKEIGEILRGYLQSRYQNWKESELVYDKWKGMP